MNNIAAQIGLQIVFILLNAFFAGSEIAFMYLSQVKLQKQKDEGNKTAAKLLEIIENPNSFLSGIQIAITLSGFLSAAFGTENFSGYLETFLIKTVHVPFSAGVVDVLSTIIITLIISFFSIGFGEMVPKRIAMQKPMAFAVPALKVLAIVNCLFKPMMVALNGVTNASLKLAGMKTEAEDDIASEEDLRLMVESSGKQGTIEADEQEWIENVFDFNDITASEVMTPQPDVVMFSIDDTVEEILTVIRQTGFTRYPVHADDDEDDICGILNVRDFLLNMNADHPRPLKELLRNAYFVPESVHGDQLFKDMQSKKQHLAIVVDEYGGVAGIVTIEDLLEEIVGDIYDEFDKADPIELTQLDDNLWRVNGSMRVEDFAEEMDIELDEDYDYDTVAGMILSGMPFIPEDGTHPSVEVDGLHFDVETIEDRKIVWAKVSKLPKPSEDEEKDDNQRHHHRHSDDEQLNDQD